MRKFFLASFIAILLFLHIQCVDKESVVETKLQNGMTLVKYYKGSCLKKVMTIDSFGLIYGRVTLYSCHDGKTKYFYGFKNGANHGHNVHFFSDSDTVRTHSFYFDGSPIGLIELREKIESSPIYKFVYKGKVLACGDKEYIKDRMHDLSFIDAKFSEFNATDSVIVQSVLIDFGNWKSQPLFTLHTENRNKFRIIFPTCTKGHYCNHYYFYLPDLEPGNYRISVNLDYVNSLNLLTQMERSTSFMVYKS